jgi:lipoprotein-releasing system permease protein
MRFELALARRYLSSPGHSLAKITARLAVAGIAFGVAALIFALALSRGLREDVREKLLGNTAHINVSRADGGGIENAPELKRELSNIGGVKTVAAASYESALLLAAQANSYTVLRGREERQAESEGDCIKASVGKELAEKTGLRAGDKADIIFGINGGDTPKKVCLVVKDIFATGLYEYDSTRIDLSLDDLARATGAAPASLEIGVSDVYNSGSIAENIRQKLGAGYKVLDWQEANKPFFAALSFERKIVLTIISLVILLSVLNITFTLALGVTQRRQDIAVLRAAGAKTSGIILVFLLEGLLLGAAGIFCGTILGLLACFTANYFGLISLPAEIYVISKITLRPDPAEIILIVLSGFLLTMLATVYPAFAAARIKPWDNLRF